MTETVIDYFKAIKIKEEHGEYLILASSGAFGSDLQTIQEQSTVRKSRERVMKDTMSQSIFSLFPVSDILHLKNKICGLSLRIANQRNTQQEPHRMSELVYVPLLDLVYRRVAVEQLMDLGKNHAEIIRMRNVMKRTGRQFPL